MERTVKQIAFGLLGFGAGATAMYFFDPRLGRRRRVLVRDQAGRFIREFRVDTSKAFVDLGNRSKGVLAEAIRRFRKDNSDNAALEARVRSILGHVVSHPHALLVFAEDGNVTLMGRILRSEVESCLAKVGTTAGVRAIENELEICESAENHPDLQGGHVRPIRHNIHPATRLGMGAAGFALSSLAFRKGIPNRLLFPIGGGMIARSLIGRRQTGNRRNAA